MNLTEEQQNKVNQAVVILAEVLKELKDLPEMTTINLHVFDDTSGQVMITNSIYDLWDAVQDDVTVYYVNDFQVNYSYEESDE